MKRAALALLLALAAASAARAQADAAAEVRRFREIRDRSFRTRSESPLTPEDFARFEGLKYYDFDAAFAFRARLEKTGGTEVFLLPTSIGTTRRYYKYGVVTFEAAGRAHRLTAFRSEWSAKNGGPLFVPFRDRTNAAETYGAGRYLEIEAPSGAETVLDFNFSFNPSCAYGSEEFSCALPPKENSLEIEIRAGEKRFAPAARK